MSPAKDWNEHVVPAEEVARSAGFRALRDRILALGDPQPQDTVVDIGSGTGLLTLPVAERVERVWAVDISPAMGEYLATKARSAGLDNVEIVVSSAISLPLVDSSADLVVSNYCFHHLSPTDKDRALKEILRVLRPGGRLAFGDMMFTVSVVNDRDRKVIADKVRAMLRMGAPGVMRLIKNSARYASRTWESPARAEWWEQALRRTGFTDVSVQQLEHEGGIGFGRRPAAVVDGR